MRRLSTIAADTLLERLHVLVGSHRRVTADLIAHLSEVDARRLHVSKGFSSLFGYCVECLGFSEDEACRRIDAARLVRRFPEVYSLLEDGSVSLTVLGLLKQHLTSENHRELLRAVSGASVRQAKELLAAQFPQPDVPSSIRKLPERCAVSEPVEKGACDAPIVTEEPLGNGAMRCPSDTAPRTGNAPTSVSTPPCATQSGAVSDATPRPAGAGSDPAPSTPTCARLATLPPAAARVKLEPLSRDRFLVKFTVSRAMKEKIELACDLLRHANPKGDLSVVLERAVDLLVAQLEKTKQGRTKRPRSERPIRSGESVGEETRPPDERTAAVCHEDLAMRSRRTRESIARATRREVVERDGWRCSFTADDGRRCDARAFLEFDHETPRSLGGGSHAEDLRLLCRAHNRLAAERIYGKAYISRAIGRAQAQRGERGRDEGTAPSDFRSLRRDESPVILSSGDSRRSSEPCMRRDES
jgi:5-methylcytosine-specific restriction endonuclease McrA